MERARRADRNKVGGSKLVASPTEVGDSNEDGTEIQISKEPILGFDYVEEEEVQKHDNNDEFQMFMDEDELSRSHHSTSKPKKKRKKKAPISSNKFLELKENIDLILAAVSRSQPPQTPSIQQLADKVLQIETIAKFTAYRILLHIEMGICKIENQ